MQIASGELHKASIAFEGVMDRSGASKDSQCASSLLTISPRNKFPRLTTARGLGVRGWGEGKDGGRVGGRGWGWGGGAARHACVSVSGLCVVIPTALHWAVNRLCGKHVPVPFGGRLGRNVLTACACGLQGDRACQTVQSDPTRLFAC